MSDVTRLLNAIERGDPQATAELLPLVYQELRTLARAHMTQERTEHTLQATALVHEAYLRLVKDEGPHWQGRGHFFAAAAEAMRRILIEHARSKNALKRGGQRERVELDDDLPPIASPCDNLDDLLGTGRGAGPTCTGRPRQGPTREALVFCRAEPRRSRRRAGHRPHNRLSALALCPGLAARCDRRQIGANPDVTPVATGTAGQRISHDIM